MREVVWNKATFGDREFSDLPNGTLVVVNSGGHLPYRVLEMLGGDDSRAMADFLNKEDALQWAKEKA